MSSRRAKPSPRHTLTSTLSSPNVTGRPPDRPLDIVTGRSTLFTRLFFGPPAHGARSVFRLEFLACGWAGCIEAPECGGMPLRMPHERPHQQMLGPVVSRFPGSFQRRWNGACAGILHMPKPQEASARQGYARAALSTCLHLPSTRGTARRRGNARAPKSATHAGARSPTRGGYSWHRG